MLDREQIDNWRATHGTHKLWSLDDPKAPISVRHMGLEVCQVCGAGEAELTEATCAEYLAEHGD